MKERYIVRTMTEDVAEREGVRLRYVGWWLYDRDKFKTVQTFPMSEKEQADGLCKLLNSIEEEGT
jgi:hypothetical protein